ncbi:hypothetical protein LOTGIDRAFT_229175 [Lottia gigantea]|uniref:C-type lectin domain-containing protein n=1 Tax=Lottia gigantea TaxID=225164 RepID=V3ZY10_LOTGI|nr:hypothetical protein LOTGIDRAFT_229175 [Lottia gigantea]ESO89307.1 hypothetical protein LOTGIDRAFT_229175 [Lottia gigantea]
MSIGNMLFKVLFLGLIHSLYGASYFDCPPGWKSYGEECWLASTHQKSWEKAYEFCRAQSPDGAFIDIRNNEENDAVEDMLKGSNFEYWFGLEVGNNNIPYVYNMYLRWNTTGTAVTEYGQQKLRMYNSHSRQCGYVDDKGSWFLTSSCNLRKQFICQKETDCLRGYYGESCDQRCNCYKADCNRTTGVCQHGCSNGWIGDQCNIEKQPAQVAVYCIKKSETEQYALIKMDLKSVDYDEVYILDENDTIVCNKSVFTRDSDDIYTLKIDMLTDPLQCSPKHISKGKYQWTLRTEEIEGFLSEYDRKFDVNCNFNGAEKLSRTKQQSLSEDSMAQLTNTEIKQSTESVRLIIQDPSTKTAVSQIKIGAKIQLAMVLNLQNTSMSAKGISPFNCKCSTSDGKISQALTDSNGCPLKNSPIYLIDSESSPSRVVSNHFDAFTIEGRSDIIFQCQFQFCFNDSPHNECPSRCQYLKTRRLIKRSVNVDNGMFSASHIFVHQN